MAGTVREQADVQDYTGGMRENDAGGGAMLPVLFGRSPKHEGRVRAVIASSQAAFTDFPSVFYAADARYTPSFAPVRTLRGSFGADSNRRAFVRRPDRLEMKSDSSWHIVLQDR
jgi:hypothetical protein